MGRRSSSEHAPPHTHSGARGLTLECFPPPGIRADKLLTWG